MRAALCHVRTPLPDVASQVAGWLNDHEDIQRLTVFSPLAGEPDLMPLLESFPNRTWCFPRVVDSNKLTFHHVKDPAKELRPAAFGIREPSEQSPEIPISQMDAFLCPGMAFDKTGGRLGRGRGYYDRILAGARPDAWKTGVCFSFQIVETTYHEAHDVFMDFVICEHGIVSSR